MKKSLILSPKLKRVNSEMGLEKGLGWPQPTQPTSPAAVGFYQQTPAVFIVNKLGISELSLCGESETSMTLERNKEIEKAKRIKSYKGTIQ